MARVRRERRAAAASEEELADVRATAGIPVPLVELRIAEPDTGAVLPWDDQASGEVQVRGPWIARQLLQRRTGGGVVYRGRLVAHR